MLGVCRVGVQGLCAERAAAPAATGHLLCSLLAVLQGQAGTLTLPPPQHLAQSLHIKLTQLPALSQVGH